VTEADDFLFASVVELREKLTHYVARRTDFSYALVADLRRVIYHHASAYEKRTGRRFPRLTPLVIPSLKQVDFYPADWNDGQIREMIAHHFKTLGNKITAVELAASVQRAFPRYKP
jgi:hypothetical protein